MIFYLEFLRSGVLYYHIQKEMNLFWNIYAYVYNVILKNWFPYNHLLRDILYKIDVKNENNILDAGCGTGYLILEILKQNKRNLKIEGIDSSTQMLKYAKKKCAKFPNVNFQLTDLNKRLNYQDNYFNKVVSCNVVYTLRDPSFVFKEFYRVLKSDGVLVIANPKPNAQGKALIQEQIASLKALSPFYRRLLYTLSFILLSPVSLVVMVMNKIIVKKGKQGDFYFLSKESYYEKLKKVGLKNIQISSTYANQDYLITATK